MTLFPESVSKQDAASLTALACNIFNTTEEKLTKKQIMYLIQIDMATVIEELSISVAITRPTEVKFATNNYHTSMKISLQGVAKITNEYLEKLELSDIIPAYLESKRTLYRFITSKYESAENFLRNLMEVAAAKDSCPKTGRLNE